jgi:alginate O-acetyltransferase complex protein AlgI
MYLWQKFCDIWPAGFSLKPQERVPIAPRMLFNSFDFIFLFLPVTLAAFAAAVRLHSCSVAVLVLLVASYVFYGYGDHFAVLLLAGSTAFNYVIGQAIARGTRRREGRLSRLLLGIGVCGDIALLAYFKYASFLVTNLDQLTGAQWPIPMIALPIGISFYTFTQIAFLVDTFCGRSATLRATDYSLFVAYFPHLVAGPIIHHAQTIPQFQRMARDAWDATDVAVGLSILTIGLFKKLVIADSVAPFADAVFGRAEVEPVAMIDSWVGAFAYSFQIYFDFSGYSDMAVGLSLLFGVRLPLNFASPYKATSIVEFWSRWHMSLSQFLRDYLYIPLGGNRKGQARRYVNLMTTMLLGGLWHGAGWTFVIWGGLHGLYLVANHLLRTARPIRSPRSPGWTSCLKRVAVFFAVTIAWVFFRADSIATAFAMLGAMSGIRGFGTTDFVALSWLAVCFIVVWTLPNTYQIFARFRPTLPVRREIAGAEPRLLVWRPNAVGAVATGAVFACCVLTINKFSPFLYFRF